jgi:hypothetical protein
MLKTLELLNKHKIVKYYEVQDFRQGPDFYFLKVRADLNNNTVLYISSGNTFRMTNIIILITGRKKMEHFWLDGIMRPTTEG